VVCAQLQARLRDGHQRRGTPTHVYQGGQSQKASHRTVWDQERRFHVLDAWRAARQKHGRRRLAGPGREMACKVAGTRVHRHSEYDASAVGHGYGTRLLLLVVMAKQLALLEQKPGCGRQGRALIFFSQRPTSIPRKHVHSAVTLSSNHLSPGSIVQVETRQSRTDETALWH
jgi:hypothetical protein